MLKTFVVAVLAIAMSVGVAEARGTRHVHQAKAKHVHRHKAMVTKHVQKNAIPMCAEGQQVTNTCACGTDASGRPFMCQEGQLCRTLAHACTQ